MRKIYLILIIVFLSVCYYAQDVSTMLELRKLFYKATVVESYVTKTETYINSHEKQDPFDAYSSMLVFMKAKYVINPYTKLSLVKKGRKKMEAAIKLYPENMESRFLRLVIQTKLPGFLGYNDAITDDQKFILDNFNSNTDKDLKARIKLYFKENEMIPDEEYKKLKI